MNHAVELITTGSELLNGRTVNTHARALADVLFPLGFSLVRDTTVPDDTVAMDEAIRSALSRVDIVLVSGGLGPTSDDLTRDVVAGIFGRKTVMHEPTRQAIADRFARTGRPMTPFVERHALVIEGADVLANSAGLAPGERITNNESTIFLLPGPPREFAAVLNDHVVPWLREHRAGPAPEVRIFEVSGIGESDIISRLEPEGFPGPGVDVAYCAALGRVEIRLSAAAGQVAGIDKAADLVRSKIGPAIYAEQRIDLAEVVGRLLRERKGTLAVAESCTGGLIGHRITAISGSSDYFAGGVIAYADDVKERDLDVPGEALDEHGAVSEIVARHMAEGARRRFGTTHGLAVTGIAGPSGGTNEKPVGLVYTAVADRLGCAVREHRFAGGREAIKEWSAQMALATLRRRLLDVV